MTSASVSATDPLAHPFGDLPDGWSVAPLSTLVDKDRGITYGVVQPGSVVADGVPIIRVNDIRSGRIQTLSPLRIAPEIAAKYSRTRLQGGELLLTLVGTVGESAVVPQSLIGWNTARAVAVVPVLDDPGACWVDICLRTSEVQHLIRSWCTTTVQATFNLRDVAKLPIPLPPKETREGIINVLGSLDDKIELNRRMNQTLEALAAAIFKAWFIDFEPVKAKAVGAKSFPSMPQPVFDALASSLVPAPNSPSGEIPSGWEMRTFGDLADLNVRTLGKSDQLQVIDYIEISEVNRGEVGTVARYSRGEEPSRARRRLRHGDSVVSTVRPDRGSHFLCLNPVESLVASTGFAVLSSRSGCWAHLYAGLTQPEIGEELGRLADGGAYPAVRPEVVAGLSLPHPNDQAVVQAFQDIAEPLFLLADQNRQENRTLAALRDSMLPKLLSGEVRVASVQEEGVA